MVRPNPVAGNHSALGAHLGAPAAVNRGKALRLQRLAPMILTTLPARKLVNTGLSGPFFILSIIAPNNPRTLELGMKKPAEASLHAQQQIRLAPLPPAQPRRWIKPRFAGSARPGCPLIPDYRYADGNDQRDHCKKHHVRHRRLPVPIDWVASSSFRCQPNATLQLRDACGNVSRNTVTGA